MFFRPIADFATRTHFIFRLGAAVILPLAVFSLALLTSGIDQFVGENLVVYTNSSSVLTAWIVQVCMLLVVWVVWELLRTEMKYMKYNIWLVETIQYQRKKAEKQNKKNIRPQTNPRNDDGLDVELFRYERR